MALETAKNHLEKYGLTDRIMILDESSATVDLAAKAVGVTPGEIAKSLSFLIGDQAVIILAEGTARVDNKKFKQTFHTKAKMIPWDDVEEWTGHAPGGVCPFGRKDGVKVYLDESLKRYDIVYPACGTGNSAVRLAIAELEQCAEPEGWVDVCKEVEA